MENKVIFTDSELEINLSQFLLKHEQDCNEDQHKQLFWVDLLKAFGANDEVSNGVFEYKVNTKKIDWLLEGRVLLEMKSRRIQSLTDANYQASGYVGLLSEEQAPRYVITCNFERFEIRDRHDNNQMYYHTLEQIKERNNLNLWNNILRQTNKSVTKEDDVNIKASDLLSHFYDSIPANIKENNREELGIFVARILFCLFADDTEIFGTNNIFSSYVLRDNRRYVKASINSLFEIFDKDFKERFGSEIEDFAKFPYVNGELFKNGRVPSYLAFDDLMTKKLADLCNFNWDKISPLIFGSIVQMAMSNKQQREEGVHYTSEDYILQILYPLFLNDLREEFDSAKGNITKLNKLLTKIGNLKFFDPACGSANFLIVAYRQMRRLATEILVELDQINGINALQATIYENVIHFKNFVGIELETQTAELAKVAMQLTKHQMNVEHGRAFKVDYKIPLPINEEASIHTANALQMDWNEVIEMGEVDYIVGNPPFRGSAMLSGDQKLDRDFNMGDFANNGKLDYVTNWYVKSAKQLKASGNRKCRVGFLSTNSITQGEQVAPLWGKLIEEYGVEIIFAYPSFLWATALTKKQGKASVASVIIGFVVNAKEHENMPKRKLLFTRPNYKSLVLDNKDGREVGQINPYLYDGEYVKIVSRSKAIAGVMPMVRGSQPTDNGYLSKLSKGEVDIILSRYPQAKKYIKVLLGSEELINSNYSKKAERFCLWLVGADPEELSSIKPIYERIEQCKIWRSQQVPTGDAFKLQNTPSLFRECVGKDNQSDWICIPRVSSEDRDYIPMAFVSAGCIPNDRVDAIYANGASNEEMKYLFGLLHSKLHYVWTDIFTGRMKQDFNYSINIVYNNFPFLSYQHSPSIATKIVVAVDSLLAVRQSYFDKNHNITLAKLYSPITMPADLLKAHQALDKLVDTLYGITKVEEQLPRLTALYKEMAGKG